MKNKNLIDSYINALVAGDTSFLWKHSNFRTLITDKEESAYLNKTLMNRLDEMHQNSESEFRKNEKRFNELIKENGLEKTFL
jgi:hypothetical protein